MTEARPAGRPPAADGEPMLADIRRQPECLRRLLGRAGELGRLGATHLAPGPGGAVYAVGCGDGWFAARALTLALGRGAGLPYRAASALEFVVYGAERLTAADRVVAVSMSGDVDRTVEAWEAALARGAGGVALTNGTGGRLGALAPVRVSLELPELAPFLCGTATYTATLLALALLLDGAAGNRPGEPPWRVAESPLREAVTRLPAVIEAVGGAIRDLVAAVVGRGLGGVRFLAAGPHVATADYGAAKLVELTRVPAWSDDVEEFAHRQFWSADPRDLVVYLAPNARTARQAAEGADALAELGFTTVAIETAGTPVPSAAHRLCLPSMPEWLALLVMPVPLQLLGYHLARATGLDPNTRAHLRDDAARFRVSRKLTRRSLVGTGR